MSKVFEENPLVKLELIECLGAIDMLNEQSKDQDTEDA